MKILTTTANPLGSLRGFGQLPALFNERWLEDVLGSFDYKWDKAFDFQNVHYPYDVSVKKDERDNPTDYRIDIALAGLSKENIKLSVKERYLVIEITKPTENRENDKTVTWLKNGISHRSAKLQFALGKEVDVKGISSSFKDGLLKINIPVTSPEITDVDISVD
jgi:HSP20 family protein